VLGLFRQQAFELRADRLGPPRQALLLVRQIVAVTGETLNLVVELGRPPHDVDDPGFLVFQLRPTTNLKIDLAGHR
jgi:hypothetical protein